MAVEHASSPERTFGPSADGDDADAKPSERDEDEQISSAVDFVAAGLVSSVSKIVVYPMETRVLLIALGAEATGGSRLWHGVVAKALENFWYNGLLWFLKERARPRAPESGTRPPVSFCGAFGASCAAILLAHPLANTTSVMQGSLKFTAQKPLGVLAAARQIFRVHGLGGFFQGWKYSLVLRIGSAMTLVVYDLVRRRTAWMLGGDASNLLAGLLGRLAEVWSCHPFKTLRSRQQNGQPALPSWSVESLCGLWSGAGTQGFADAVKIGIRFLLIERMRTLLQGLLARGRRPRRLPDAPKAKGADEEGPPQEAMGA